MKVMIKTKFPITNQFLDLKQMFKEGVTDLEAFDNLSGQLLIDLTQLTESGVSGDDIIEGVKLDLWKDRVWHLIERAGILPEYKDEDGDELIESLEGDVWYKNDSSEFDVEDEEPKKEMDFKFDPFYGF